MSRKDAAQDYQWLQRNSMANLSNRLFVPGTRVKGVPSLPPIRPEREPVQVGIQRVFRGGWGAVRDDGASTITTAIPTTDPETRCLHVPTRETRERCCGLPGVENSQHAFDP